MNKNDEKIVALKNKIAEMKEDIKENKKAFVPMTNCILVVDDVTYNIHTLTVDKLRNLLVYLNYMKMSVDALRESDYADVIGNYRPIYSGYSLDIWMDEIANKIYTMQYKEKERKLAQAEKMLNELLSDDKKVEMQIDEISKQFGLE